MKPFRFYLTAEATAAIRVRGAKLRAKLIAARSTRNHQLDAELNLAASEYVRACNPRSIA